MHEYDKMYGNHDHRGLEHISKDTIARISCDNRTHRMN